MKKNQFTRVCLEILGGIAISFVLCAILIALGYYNVHSAGLNNYAVNFFGIPIYQITNKSGELVGVALNQNMGMVGIVCSIVIIMIVESIRIFKIKKTSN